MRQWVMTLLDMAILTFLVFVFYWVGLTDQPERLDFAMIFAISALHQQHGKVSK